MMPHFMNHSATLINLHYNLSSRSASPK